MASLNRIMLIGNLTRDPELTHTPGGVAICNLSLAVNRRYKKQDGTESEEVCFINCTAWAKAAEAAAEYLKKGSLVYIEGRLQYEQWEKDGQKRSCHKVRCERVSFLGNLKNAEKKTPTEAEDKDDSSIPF